VRPKPGLRFSHKDLYAGLAFAGFGVVGLAAGRHYPLGTAVRMGPGYFPMVLSGLLLVLGAAIALRAFFSAPGRVGKLSLRPLVLILGAATLFAMLVETAGLAISSVVLVVASSLGGQGARPLEILILSVFLSGLTVAVFILGLGLPLSIWPG